MTATGRATGRALFGDGVLQAWLPYDAPFAVRRFLAHFKPCVGLIMETELWPNLVALAREAGVPIYLVNARMSERSARLYAAFPFVTRPMLRALSGVAAQTDADAARLAALGAPAAVVTGNLKFDATPRDEGEALGRELRSRFGESRPVWVAASTRDGEEAMILDALAAHRLPPGTLTVIVPRHPQRFAAVAELLRRRGVPFVLRSGNLPVPADVEVVLGDSMGEMAGYYMAADVAFVGGSLLPLGGQNLIEPISAGRPTLVGPHMFNFAEAAQEARAGGRRARGGGCERAGRDRRRAASPMRRAAPRCAPPRSRFTRRTTAPPTGSWRGSRRGSTRRSPRSAPRSVSPELAVESSTSWSVSVPTEDLRRSTPIRYLK